MKKICHVLFEHRIFDGRIFYKEAVSLAKHGFDVTLLVPAIDSHSLGLRKEVIIGPDQNYVREGVRFASYAYNKALPRAMQIRRFFCYRSLFIKMEEIDAALVFTRTRASAQRLAEELNTRGYAVDALHGDIPHRVVGRHAPRSGGA